MKIAKKIKRIRLLNEAANKYESLESPEFLQETGFNSKQARIKWMKDNSVWKITTENEYIDNRLRIKKSYEIKLKNKEK